MFEQLRDALFPPAADLAGAMAVVEDTHRRVGAVLARVGKRGEAEHRAVASVLRGLLDECERAAVALGRLRGEE